MLSFVVPEMDWYMVQERRAQAASLTLHFRRATDRLRPAPPTVAVMKHTYPKVVDIALEPLRL